MAYLDRITATGVNVVKANHEGKDFYKMIVDLNTGAKVKLLVERKDDWTNDQYLAELKAQIKTIEDNPSDFLKHVIIEEGEYGKYAYLDRREYLVSVKFGK